MYLLSWNKLSTRIKGVRADHDFLLPSSLVPWQRLWNELKSVHLPLPTLSEVSLVSFLDKAAILPLWNPYLIVHSTSVIF